MHVLILGAGGIGGYFGGRLAEAGVDVTFLVRPARADSLVKHGLKIESPVGNALLTPSIALRATAPADLVILSCKAYDLDAAVAAIGPAVGPQTIVLPLLNGLAHLDRLDAAFGADRTIGGLAHISTTLAADGTIRHLNRLQTLTFGARGEAQRDACDKLQAAFSQVSFDVKRSDAIVQDMWEKFAFITAAGAITCLMRASVGAIVATDKGHALTLQMLEECNAVAAASGYAIRQKARDWAVPFLTQPGSDFTASMLRDLEGGGPIEADHLQGDMVRRGAQLKVATPILEVALCHLQAYQNRQALPAKTAA